MRTTFRGLVPLAVALAVVISVSTWRAIAADPGRPSNPAADPFGAPNAAPDPFAPSNDKPDPFAPQPAAANPSALTPLPDKFTPADVNKPVVLEKPTKVERPKVTAAANDGLTPEECVRRELAKPTKLEFIETPLREVMQFIAEQHGLNIEFDEAPLKEAGLGSDTAIPNVNLSSNSLASALPIILRPLKLTYVVSRDGIVLITTQEAANTMLAVKVYPVQDLIATKDDLGENVLAYDELIDTLMAAVEPAGWDHSIAGAIKGVQGTLVANQPAELHAKIASVLAAIRDAKRMQEKTPGGMALLAFGTAAQQAGYRKLNGLLEKPGHAEFIETPLREVMQFFTDENHIPIVFDEAALKEAGLGSDTAVPNVNLKGLPVRAILELILRPLKLTDVIKNEVVVITTPQAANTMLETRVYPVGDLLAWKSAAADEPPAKELSDSILATVAPQGWEKDGGPGTIRYFAPAQALVVSQTQAAHAEIERFLEQLRADHREHPPAAAIAAAAIPSEDKPVTRTFALKTTALTAAEIVDLVTKAQAKTWTAEGAFIHPTERVEIIKTAGRPDQKIVHGSMVVRQKPAALRELRRLLREMDVWPSNPPAPSDSPISFMQPAKESSTKTAALSDVMPAPAQCDGVDGVCPADAKPTLPLKIRAPANPSP